MYQTKEGKYYHIHGSLEATTTLNMIGLPGHRPDLDDYFDIIEVCGKMIELMKVIGNAVKKFTVPELEEMNAKHRQAGVEVLKYENFLKTEHGKITAETPLWLVEVLETETPPAPFPKGGNQILKGIKVLEMCRIIAGPTITRILAEYGAEVLKITSPNLSDVPFFQVDG